MKLVGVKRKLFGNSDPVFYVWAPRWVDASAGIRALHYFCDALNQQGETAYLVLTEPRHNGEPRMNSKLFTPPLTQEIVDAHHSSQRPAIAVYPETVSGNPLNADLVVRLLMNFSGALGGPGEFDQDEYILAFSKKIAADYYKKTGSKPQVLFIPPVDPEEFAFQTEKDNYQVVYAGKYRAFVGKPPEVGTLPSVEIFRDGPKKQSREQVKKLLANASVFYSFENSSLVTESILSGTPAGFITSKFLGEIIAEDELGWDGAFLGDSPEELKRARESVRAGADRYLQVVSDFPKQLNSVLEKLKFQAVSVGVARKITVPHVDSVITANRFHIAFQILKNQGIVQLSKESWKFFLSLVRK